MHLSPHAVIYFTKLVWKMQNNQLCPNCKTAIGTGIVKKIHPDVFDELVCSDCSNETEKLLEEIHDYEKARRTTMLEMIKKLDKQNTSLTKKKKQESFETCYYYHFLHLKQF